MPTDMHIASLVNCLFKSLAHVLTGLSVFMLLTWKDLYTFWMQMQHRGSARYLLVVTQPMENNSPTVFSSEQTLSTTLQYQTTKRATDGGQLCGGERQGLGVVWSTWTSGKPEPWVLRGGGLDTANN